MRRSSFALASLLAFAGSAFGGRTAVQVRRHGDTGWRLGRPASGAEAAVHAALAASAVALAAAPVAALASGADRGGPASRVPALAGAALAVGGTAVTLVAQAQMGASWRIGVDPAERTDLVSGGLYRSVRNPIFTGMVLFAAGQALLVPGRLAVVGAGLLVGAVEAQVRYVEEPVLLATHADAYRRWASATGRFVPAVGRLR
jgi:protein-S-isoprenylcysteine O-methyltransferase Ste14